MNNMEANKEKAVYHYIVCESNAVEKCISFYEQFGFIKKTIIDVSFSTSQKYNKFHPEMLDGIVLPNNSEEKANIVLIEFEQKVIDDPIRLNELELNLVQLERSFESLIDKKKKQSQKGLPGSIYRKNPKAGCILGLVLGPLFIIGSIIGLILIKDIGIQVAFWFALACGLFAIIYSFVVLVQMKQSGTKEQAEIKRIIEAFNDLKIAK